MSKANVLSALTQRELKKRVSYDPSTGKFVWLRTRRSDRIGREAGCVKNGYCQIRIMGRAFLAHRLAWFYVHGVWPREIDHADRNRSNNRISNLRPCTNVQNQANRPASSAVGLKGVSSNGGKFQAHIRKDKRLIHLGTFNTANDAHGAYMAAARNLFGEFAVVGGSE